MSQTVPVIVLILAIIVLIPVLYRQDLKKAALGLTGALLGTLVSFVTYQGMFGAKPTLTEFFVTYLNETASSILIYSLIGAVIGVVTAIFLNKQSSGLNSSDT